MINEYEVFINLMKVDKSQHTIRSYKTNITSFLNDLNINSLDDLKNLKSIDINNYFSSLKNKGMKESSINARQRVLKVFFNWLIDNEYISKTPFSAVKKMKEPSNIPVILTREERDQIILSCKNNIKLKLIMALLLYTGMRREEITNIKMEDIFDGKIMVHGKGRKQRILALNEYVQNLLNQYIIMRGDDFEYLFYSKKGFGDTAGTIHKITPEAIRYSVKKAAELSGMDEERINDISCHTMRRTFACDLAKDGVSHFQIQMALGHSNIQTTSVYLKPAGAEIANDALLNQKAPGVI